MILKFDFRSKSFTYAHMPPPFPFIFPYVLVYLSIYDIVKHLNIGGSIFFFSPHCFHSAVFLSHLVGSILAICPAQRHFDFNIVSLTSSVLIRSLIYSIGVVSFNSIFIIAFSMWRWVV